MREEAAIEAHWRGFASGFGASSAAAVFRGLPARDSLDEDALLARTASPERVAAYRGIASEHRRREWLAARAAEQELRDRLGERILTSVSHSGDRLVAIGCRESVDDPVRASAGIGVDLESVSRPLSDAAWDWLMNEREKALWRAERVIAWAVKEAAFKADPENAGQVVSAYRMDVVELSRERARLIPPSGRTAIEATWRLEAGWLIAFAVAVPLTRV